METHALTVNRDTTHQAPPQLELMPRFVLYVLLVMVVVQATIQFLVYLVPPARTSLSLTIMHAFNASQADI